MALTQDRLAIRPIWPPAAIDASGVDLDYYPPADELTVFFGGRPVPATSDFLEVEGFRDVAVLVDDDTREVVGLHVMPLLMGAVRDHPEWAALAWGALANELGEESLRAALPPFIETVRRVFEQSGMVPQPDDGEQRRS